MQILPGGNGKRESLDAQRAYGRYASLGLTFAATIALFLWLGWWVDQKLGTAPIFMLVGLFLGFAGGMISIVKKIPAPRGRAAPPDHDTSPE